MKTPDEIKKGLKICGDDKCGKDCPYHDNCYMEDALCELASDALEYIQQLENHIGELTEKVAQFEAAQPKWISVEERLPDDCIDVLVFVRNGYTSCISIAHVLKGGWWTRGIPIGYVTHWMPLIEQPQDEP